MFIQNVLNRNFQYNNQKFENKTNNYSKNQVFTGNSELLKKTINLTSEELSGVTYISEIYDKILSMISSLNGIYQTKFKSLYPNLVSGEKVKGFIFDSLNGFNNRRLQVVRFNSKNNSDELLTFGILDKENKNLLRYRVDKNGTVLVTSKKENLGLVSQNPFSDKTKIESAKYLKNLISEMEKLKFYSENFKTINRRTIDSKDDTKVFDTMRSLYELKHSEGIKDEIGKIVSNYKRLSQTLNFRQGKYALALKKAYFGDSVSAKTKGIVLKNYNKSGNTYSFCPLQSKDDDRLFRIFILDNDDKMTNAFVFFESGKVARVKTTSLGSNDLRPNNLIDISDEEIKNYNLSEILDTLNTEFNKFEDFIEDYKVKRKQRSINTSEVAQDRQLKLEQRKKELEQKAQIKALAKQEKENQKQLKLEQRKKESEQKAQIKSIVKQKQTKTESRVKYATVTTQTKNDKVYYNDKVFSPDNLTGHNIDSTISLYKNMTLSSIKELLDNIFSLPVEKRSTQFIHEKLPNGNIFAGRFHMKASDGADITVSRVKSPKYVDFTYYSINVKKSNKEYTFNIDPVVSKILASENGKPIINRKYMVTHISKDEFLSKYPEAINLPIYIKELSKVETDGVRKYIDSSSKISSNQSVINQKEKEIQEILQKSADDLFD